jgi:hypothetical protein
VFYWVLKRGLMYVGKDDVRRAMVMCLRQGIWSKAERLGGG